ncbi:MAG: carbon-nitrogen hydrolase family protein [Clostridium sp.]|nr:carbon-nitrogen hydrolase family protein [Clostridium culturomicium]MDU4889498.1 carbon-nitrogen hydrolase family protein [Clostridium sp.]MDU7082858.1 carbon-nitrogen hydrolase family protein [Clostridium sp.]
MSKMKVAMIQMRVVEDKLRNIEIAAEYINEIVTENVDMVVLPEMFCCPYKTENFPIYGEPEGGPCYRMLSSIAKEHGIYLVAGSVPEKDEEGRVFNTSYVFDREGNKIGKHRKMHLFDINVEGGQCFKESDTLSAGKDVTVFDTEFGKMGLAICYDFRFPELSRLMVEAGAKVIVVPAAFNMTTGPAHWDILFRTRALDNQVYTIGTAPARDESSCYTSYGNSMAVSPWGDTICHMDEKEGYRIVELDLDYVDRVRNELPLLAHRRKDVYSLLKNNTI